MDESVKITREYEIKDVPCIDCPHWVELSCNNGAYCVPFDVLLVDMQNCEECKAVKVKTAQSELFCRA